MTDPRYVYRWRKWRPELWRRTCRVIARGRLNSALVVFADGTRHVVSRNAIRRANP